MPRFVLMQGSRVIATVLLLTALIVNGARKGSGLRSRNLPRSRASTRDHTKVVVPLERMSVRDVRGASAPSDASFYVGKITVGTPPQEFQVLFDTGSGHVLLPHKACKTKVCLEHHRYSPWASATAEDVNADGTPVMKDQRLAKGKVNRSFASLEFTQADVGDGIAKGVLVRDHVCLSSGPAGHRGHEACAEMAMLAATDEDAMPFAAMPADGIIGLGLEGLAVSALSSFYARLVDSSHNMLPEFGISLDRNGGKIIFGGRDDIASVASPLEWFPVTHPGDGMWQIEILSVRVGGDVIDSCSDSCHAVVDTGSSRIGVLGDGRVNVLRTALTSRVIGGDCQGPDLQFDLPRGLTLTLSAEDYTNGACTAEIGALNLTESKFVRVYSLGTNVIRRYYTAFDWANAQVGFAPNAGSRPLRVPKKNTYKEVPASKSSPSALLVF